MSQSLRVLQWNTLADGLAQNGNFIKATKESLEWEHRSPRLLSVILDSNADCICMQEVNHFDDYFSPLLTERGYAGLFLPKHQSPAQKYGFKSDGCALFFRTSRFILAESWTFHFSGVNNAPHNQGGIIAQLSDRGSSEDIFIATTHLKAKSGAENEATRLLQVNQILERLAVTSLRCTMPMPCVLCGDMNSEPDSEVYNAFQDHPLGLYSAYAFPSVSLSPDRKVEGGQSEESKWEMIQPRGVYKEPLFTTWKFRPQEQKTATIDYIWFTALAGRLVPVKRLALPSKAIIGPAGLPSSIFPSDHLPLLCEFRWSHEMQSTSVQSSKGARMLNEICEIVHEIPQG